MVKLEDILAYKIASELSDFVWEIVTKWDYFAKKTIGSQFVEAVDSRCKKSFKRKLLTAKEDDYILEKLRKLPREINYQIKLASINLKI